MAAIKAQSDPTNEEVSDGTSPYTPALTSSAITPLKTGSITCTSADTEYSAAVTGVGATGFYQVFVTVEGPNGNLGDGDVLRTANENPTKLAPCVAPQSGELITWTATDTTLKADVFLSAPAVVHYVLLRHDAPAPNPTQILLGLDANGASPPCADCDFADSSSSAVARNTSCARRHHDLERHWVHAGDVRESQQRGGVRPVHGHDALQRHGGGVGQHRPRRELRFLRGVFAKPDRPGDGPRGRQRRAALLASYPKLADVRATTATLLAKLNEAGTVWYAVLEGGHDDGGRRAPESRLGRFVSSLRERLGERRRARVRSRSTGLESKKTYDAYLVAMDDEDGGDYGGNTQAAVTKRTFTAASADGHLGGVAAVTAAAAAGDFGGGSPRTPCSPRSTRKSSSTARS